jgi:hypothetical protein
MTTVLLLVALVVLVTLDLVQRWGNRPDASGQNAAEPKPARPEGGTGG